MFSFDTFPSLETECRYTFGVAWCEPNTLLLPITRAPSLAAQVPMGCNAAPQDIQGHIFQS